MTSENSLDYFRELIDELTCQRDEARFLTECRDRELAEREKQVETLTQERDKARRVAHTIFFDTMRHSRRLAGDWQLDWPWCEWLAEHPWLLEEGE